MGITSNDGNEEDTLEAANEDANSIQLQTGDLTKLHDTQVSKPLHRDHDKGKHDKERVTGNRTAEANVCPVQDVGKASGTTRRNEEQQSEDWNWETRRDYRPKGFQNTSPREGLEVEDHDSFGDRSTTLWYSM
ncbi:hypothetical protein L873DRAFT_1790230 [Choiromyces venosus 120613-1]|uniref:Uncharacterized protein n=1 Tax=Choiromyces venosus 120613-1 TaxID=1336337 RepID=A0A3N4JK78_9PEZI|nr:hypothetical protein L873DRAFT_1790230 [Choiromyces venosus 120613-1]